VWCSVGLVVGCERGGRGRCRGDCRRGRLARLCGVTHELWCVWCMYCAERGIKGSRVMDDGPVASLAQTDWEKGTTATALRAFDAPPWPDKRCVCLSCPCEFWIAME